MQRNASDIIRSGGDALINIGACYPDLQKLKERFDILTFLDFCCGLDAAVLHNRLFDTNYLYDTNLFSDQLVNSGILKSKPRTFSKEISEKTLKMIHPQTERRKSLLKFVPKIIYEDEKDIGFDIVRTVQREYLTLKQEDVYEIPLVLSARFTPIYLQYSSVSKEALAVKKLNNELSAIYSDFSDSLAALRNTVGSEEIIRMPPIALEILDRADNSEEIGDVLLDIRKQYSKLRNEYAELDAVLKSGDIPLKKKLKAKALIQNSVNRLFSTKEADLITTSLSLATSANDMTKIGGFSNGIDPEDINYTKLVGYLIERARSIYWKFRLRPLHSTKRRYLQLSDNRFRRIIEKHFGHSLNSEDTKTICHYLDMVSSLKE